MPDSLLPIAERAGLLGRISTWVVHETCRQAQAWQRAGLGLRVGFPLPPVLWQTARLRARVVSFAIDDFGTGYSSLNRPTR
jgi:EAL domain-containing protein (putative c-di-GMP-specific phosphodiesterase class I)